MKRGMKDLRSLLTALFVGTVALSLVACSGSLALAQKASSDPYRSMKLIGKQAGKEACAMIKEQARRFSARKGTIALSNAGYAEIAGQSTMAALDGLSEVTRVSRGANTLLEIHSAPESPLWFAVYDQESGYCAYLQVKASAVGNTLKASDLFEKRSIERIDADQLFSTNPTNFTPDFGGNEFRIVTIANGIAAGVPAYVARSFEYHDHYCPGVTSGIMLANYVKKHFAGGAKAYFVHGLQPWCKEDALMVMLNATPGKSGYAVTYSTADDRKNWEYPDAANIIYGQKADNTWEGLVLGFTFASSTGCEQYTNSTINKLCMDLWYLEKMDSPEEFVKLYDTITLGAADHPKNYARPGVDVMVKQP